MFKSKKLAGAFALSLISISVYAQPTDGESFAQQQHETYIIGSPFNYVTINELLSIDERKALDKERKDAAKIGLTRTDGSNAASVQADLSILNTEQESTVSSSSGNKENTKGLGRKEVVLEKSPAEQAIAFNPELIGIYGVGNQLSAIFRYGGYSYKFVSGQKKNQRANKGNSLSLISIGDHCVSVYDNEIKTQVKACLGEAN